MNGTARYLCGFRLPSIKCNCLLSVAYACSYHNPTATMGTRLTTLTTTNPSPTQRHTCGTAKFCKMTLEAAYGREINIKLFGKSSGGHSCSQHANCILPLWHCVVTKLHILEQHSIVPQHKVHLCNDHSV